MVDLGFHTRLDYGSRPAWTSGLERGTACWLEEFREQLLAQCGVAMYSVDSLAVQCFTTPLMKWDESIRGSLVQDVLQKRASDDRDYVAPFAVLNQLYTTYQGKFRSGESADAAEACRLLIDRCVNGSDNVHLLPTM